MPCGTVSHRLATAGWVDQRVDLYHGIPSRIVARAEPALVAECWRLLVDAERALSAFAVDSELVALNHASTQDGRALSPLLARALRAAIAAWRISRGACDAAAGALVETWRRAVAEQTWPSGAAIHAARGSAGLDGVAIDAADRLRCGARRLRLDLGGVAKGLLVDLVDARLAEHGVADALVQIGGETSCRGRSPRASAWRVGVQHPLVGDAAWAVLAAPADGLSCSTSGDYRRDRRIGARPVSHLIDPRTGEPADDDLLGVTVALAGAGRVADAEALTKAGVFLPLDEALDAASSRGGELLALRARDDGIEESASLGWRAWEAA